ncbi:hypothetical protein MINTM005_13670 [Mycobacterium intracellulare]|uniref:ATP-dependent Clp protease proteolytic subunit n=1 Tax=Mycobacterium intracellulare TaxID=1767 RepID=UPI001926EF02|nr:ATP-dependent Clp protease proteolytic subunit [Mycobacterium intracellulare]BCO56123.1 hypothetical protein MINTM005_13670 [Mycobacterium intracellulare]
MSDEEFDLDATQALALAEKYSFEAEHARWQAKREELSYQQELMEHQWQFDGVYSFFNRVTPKSVNKLLHTMALWDKHDPEGDWVIYLNSVGGDEVHCYALLDELTAHSRRGKGGHHIEIRVRGWAASAAGVILQAADHRVMGPTSQLMIHKGSGGIKGDIDQCFDEVEYMRRSVDRMVDVFLSRTDKVDYDDMLAKINRRDWWVNAEQAVELGFADAIG